MSRTTVRIPSRTPGWFLDAWLYHPARQTLPWPVIVMANGLGCTKHLGLAAYAAAFSAAGYACVVFDYRGWGDSDGMPRNCVVVRDQQEDYRTVLKWARHQKEYDAQRAVVWGFSFAGGHILTLASDPSLNLSASIALNPYCGRPLPPFQFSVRYITLFLLGLLDLLADFLGLPPIHIPTVGPPGPRTISALAAPGALAGFASVTKEAGHFPNQINASIFFRAPWHHRPRDSLHTIDRPVLLLAAAGDRICPPQPVIAAGRAVGSAELVQLTGDHFDAFEGNVDWQRAVEAQIAFLQKHVPTQV